MTKDQYELLLEAFREDLQQVEIDYAMARITGEQADYRVRRIYDEIEELDRQYTEQQMN